MFAERAATADEDDNSAAKICKAKRSKILVGAQCQSNQRHSHLSERILRLKVCRFYFNVANMD